MQDEHIINCQEISSVSAIHRLFPRAKWLLLVKICHRLHLVKPEGPVSTKWILQPWLTSGVQNNTLLPSKITAFFTLAIININVYVSIQIDRRTFEIVFVSIRIAFD